MKKFLRVAMWIPLLFPLFFIGEMFYNKFCTLTEAKLHGVYSALQIGIFFLYLIQYVK